MAVVIYNDSDGARTTKIFGCSFKSITAQMGFNSQPIVFSVTVVEEEHQDFTLKKNDVRSAQYVAFGELQIFGIVQSWERTTTDPNGTGIYVVRLTDCRTVLDSANIANVYVDQPDSEVALIDSNIIYIGSTGHTVADPDQNREEDTAIPFSQLIERVEAATLNYGNNTFEVDMTELKTLTNLLGEGPEQYYIEGEVRSLVSTITEFCNAVGAEWWVESKRKSVVDDTIVIQIKIVRRLDAIGNPQAIEMDELIVSHGSDHVIRRKDGYENTDLITNKVIWGGIKRNLKQFSDVQIKQFWGFDSNGQPLLFPSYTVPDESQYRRILTTADQMEDAINGDLENQMDLTQLNSLTKYANDFWGKRFYIELSKSNLSDTGKDLPDYPEVISAGWWEGDAYPHGTRQFDADVLIKLTTEDGRWGPFVKLSNIFLTGSGTVESPTVAHYVTWSPGVTNSNNVISRESEEYVKCKLEQYGRFVVITLPVALARYDISDTGEVDEDRFTRHDSLSKIWVPLMDRGIHYGPWSNAILSKSSVPQAGRSEVSVDRDLVPWTFGIRGLTNSAAQEGLVEMAAQKIDTLPGLSIINTGQLEVAGIPAVNIGQSIGKGGSITDIFIRFDQNGITTRYSMKLYTKELGEFKHKKQKEQEEQEIEDEKQKEDEFPETKDDLETPPETENESDTEGLSGPKKATREYVYQKPEGALGIIDFKEGGPFYTVRRLNYADIDPDTFAGGANITGSYFLAEWNNVRNLAEPENSPGLLPVGTRVTVSIFSEGENRPQVAYIEQTPQVFSPPPVIQ